ncbi:MAG: NAD(P)H:quinone oxidoreductase [Rhodospirillales bacterium]|nr:NAD(P)H:quinone oxidoreductase [Rhodospirillales bacterium]
MTTNVLIAFYSRNGSTEALAKALAEGAEAAGAAVRLRRARDIVGPEVMAQVPGWADSARRMDALYAAPTADDIEWADGIVFGTPTRYGNTTAELKAYIDSLGGVWFQGKFNGKAGSAFCATMGTHGGAETTVTSLYNVMAHLGLIIVPTGYADPVMFQAGTPYGAHAAVDGQHVTAVPENDLAVARYQGRRVAQVATALKTLRG